MKRCAFFGCGASAGMASVSEVTDGALRRDVVGDVDAFAGFPGAIARLLDVTGPAEREADLAVREVIDVPGGMHVPHVRTDRHQHLLGRLQVGRRIAVRVFAEKDHDRGNDFGRRIEQRDAAVGEFRDHGRGEEHPPTVDRRVRQTLLDLRDVITGTGRDPHVGHAVGVTRIVLRLVAGDFRDPGS